MTLFFNDNYRSPDIAYTYVGTPYASIKPNLPTTKDGGDINALSKEVFKMDQTYSLNDSLNKAIQGYYPSQDHSSTIIRVSSEILMPSERFSEVDNNKCINPQMASSIPLSTKQKHFFWNKTIQQLDLKYSENLESFSELKKSFKKTEVNWSHSLNTYLNAYKRLEKSTRLVDESDIDSDSDSSLEFKFDNNNYLNREFNRLIRPFFKKNEQFNQLNKYFSDNESENEIYLSCSDSESNSDSEPENKHDLSCSDSESNLEFDNITNLKKESNNNFGYSFSSIDSKKISDLDLKKHSIVVLDNLLIELSELNRQCKEESEQRTKKDEYLNKFEHVFSLFSQQDYQDFKTFIFLKIYEEDLNYENLEKEDSNFVDGLYYDFFVNLLTKKIQEKIPHLTQKELPSIRLTALCLALKFVNDRSVYNQDLILAFVESKKLSSQLNAYTYDMFLKSFSIMQTLFLKIIDYSFPTPEDLERQYKEFNK